jgi:hypothetical protein
VYIPKYAKIQLLIGWSIGVAVITSALQRVFKSRPSSSRSRSPVRSRDRSSFAFSGFHSTVLLFFLLSFWLWTPHFFLPTRSCLIFVVSHTILHKSITISILYERPPTFDQKVSAQVGLVVRLLQRIWKTATLCSMQRLGRVKA